jgi:hypothetical protein
LGDGDELGGIEGGVFVYIEDTAEAGEDLADGFGGAEVRE